MRKEWRKAREQWGSVKPPFCIVKLSGLPSRDNKGHWVVLAEGLGRWLKQKCFPQVGGPELEPWSPCENPAVVASTCNGRKLVSQPSWVGELQASERLSPNPRWAACKKSDLWPPHQMHMPPCAHTCINIYTRNAIWRAVVMQTLLWTAYLTTMYGGQEIILGIQMSVIVSSTLIQVEREKETGVSMSLVLIINWLGIDWITVVQDLIDQNSIACPHHSWSTGSKCVDTGTQWTLHFTLKVHLHGEILIFFPRVHQRLVYSSTCGSGTSLWGSANCVCIVAFQWFAKRCPVSNRNLLFTIPSVVLCHVTWL